MDLSKKKVLVVGSGISGIAAMKLLNEVGAEGILFDGNEKLDIEELRKKFEEGVNASIYIGTLPKEVEESIDIVVLSPGVPTDIPLVNSFRERNIPIWGEIELAYQFEKGKVLAITGYIM